MRQRSRESLSLASWHPSSPALENFWKKQGFQAPETVKRLHIERPNGARSSGSQGKAENLKSSPSKILYYFFDFLVIWWRLAVQNVSAQPALSVVCVPNWCFPCLNRTICWMLEFWEVEEEGRPKSSGFVDYVAELAALGSKWMIH
jgi:hypothetical protein